MREFPLSPYLYWVKSRAPVEIDLTASNMLACSMADLPGAREAVDLTAADRGGYPPLRDAIAAHYGVSGDHVATASGCSAANFLAIGALVGPGDTVLMETPWYDQIEGACKLLGAHVQHFERRFDDGYRIDVASLCARITPATSLVIVTTPHNPSGMAIDLETLTALQAMAEDANVYVLVDEVYLDVTNLVQASRNPELESRRYPPAALVGDRLVSVSSLTKSYGLAGLRCGWVIAAPEIAERIRRVRDVIDNIGAAPADRLAALAFSQLDRLGARAGQHMMRQHARLGRFLGDHPELELAGPPEASIIFPRMAGVADSDPFVQRLLEDHGVSVAPGRLFGAPAHFRVSLGGSADALDRGLEQISRALRDVPIMGRRDAE
jgi:aspartate/methionine/tyrosine aminotransferase